MKMNTLLGLALLWACVSLTGCATSDRSTQEIHSDGSITTKMDTRGVGIFPFTHQRSSFVAPSTVVIRSQTPAAPAPVLQQQAATFIAPMPAQQQIAPPPVPLAPPPQAAAVPGCVRYEWREGPSGIGWYYYHPQGYWVWSPRQNLP